MSEQTQMVKAKEILLKEGIVIFPTETVYGIGCLLESENAISKLYSIKLRGEDQPTLGLFENLEKASRYVDLKGPALKLAEKFWPGPLTIVAPTIKRLPQAVLGAHNSFGVRVPNHPWLLALLRELKQPLAGPSANFKGQRPPRNLAEIDKELLKLVDYVVTLEPGNQQPSTVVGFSEENEVTILREGPISRQRILQSLGKED